MNVKQWQFLNAIENNMTTPTTNNPLDPLVIELTNKIMERLPKTPGDVVTGSQLTSAIEERLVQFNLNVVVPSIKQLRTTFSLDCERLQKAIAAIPLPSKGEDSTPREIILKDYRLKGEGEKPDTTSLGYQHPAMSVLIEFANLKLPVYIHGPTGGGKTTATKILAEKVLKVPFYRKVMSSQSSESTLMGYGNSAGEYVPGIAYTAYKDGGLLLVDELDNGNANINTVIKQLNDGDTCYFPVVGNIPKHENFYLIANANTVGNGATRQYVGRAPQDKAMLNTFAYLEWNYDPDFERELATVEWLSCGGTKENLNEMETSLQGFWKFRKAAEELNSEHIFSTRNLLYIIRAEAQKVDKKIISKCLLARGLSKEDYTKLFNKARTIGSLVPATRGDVKAMFEEKPATDILDVEVL